MNDERDDAIITRQAPAWAWDTIDDTLYTDSVSSAFDEALRDEIAEAIGAMKEVHKCAVKYAPEAK